MHTRHGDRRTRYVFGPFTVDPVAGRLLRGNAAVPLRRKSWEVLCHLLARPRELVSNQELLDAVWPGIAITPQTLTNVIRELRTALDDSARTPRFIETVHGRGYVFHVDGPATPRAAVAAAALVGRESELASLEQAWAQARAGRSRMVFLSGEPGIGKTALAERFVAAHAAGPPARVARGGCVETHGAGEPYLPLLAAIEGLAAGGDGRGVRAKLRTHAPTWLLQLPWRADADERARLERALHQSSGARMLREGIALIGALAEVAPLLLVLEDLHWADLATLDLLAALARRPIPAPVLILATYRPADATAQAHPVSSLARDLIHAGHALELALAPLRRAAVGEYLAARLGPGVAGADLVDRLEQHCAGNPLFLRSLVDQLIAQGAFAADGEDWRLAGAPEDLLVDLPENLRDFVLRSLEKLPATGRAAVEIASVAGLEFAPEDIAAPAGLTALEVEAICHDLAQVGRLLRPARAVAADESAAPGYEFVHAAYRRVVYDQIAPLRRRMLHREVGLELEARGGDRGVPAARLAAHFERAALPAKAAHYCDLAAGSSAQRFAYRECATHLRTALAQLALDGRAGSAEAAGLYWRLGTISPLVAGYAAPQSGDAFARALAIFSAIGALPGTFFAAAGLCRYELARGEIGAARAHADRLIELVRTDLPELRALGLLWAGFTASALGELDRARTLLEQGAAAPPSVMSHHDDHRVIASQLALILAAVGEPDRARSEAARALRLAHDSGRPSEIAHAWLIETERCVILRDADAGRAAAATVAALATDNDFVSFLAFSRFYAALFDQTGSCAERVAAMRAAMAQRRQIGDRWHESMLLGLIAETLLGAGDVGGALESLDLADAHVERTSERHYQAELQRLRGECAGAQGRARDAALWLRRARQTACGQGARVFEARVAASRWSAR